MQCDGNDAGNGLDTPVLLIVFDRSDTVSRIFEAIRAARPKRLYVAGDGPRPDRPDEALRCEEARKAATAVDWPCELKTRFLPSNIGCIAGVSSAISWFFENEPEGIVFEHDCLPCPDFFRFAQAMLERYRDDERIMHISGDNFNFGRKYGDASYYFSRYRLSWGWATWRRAWKHYDPELKSFPDFVKARVIEGVFPRQPLIQRRWLQIFRAMHRKSPHFTTWDYQWDYAIFSQNGLAVIPNVNLISNICPVGMHRMKPGTANLPFGTLGEIVHPAFVAPNEEADRKIYRLFYKNPNLFVRAAGRIKRDFCKLKRLLSGAS